MKTGDKVSFISWPPGADGRQCELTETPNQTMHYEEQNLGDHGVGWIVLTRDGQEAARHNIKYLESIVWK